MKLIDSPNSKIGCYVEGGRGWTAIAHLFAQFANLDDDEQGIVDAYLSGDDETGETLDVVADMAGELEQMLNDALPADRIAQWRDGEFFIQAFCGADDDCTDDECGCQDW